MITIINACFKATATFGTPHGWRDEISQKLARSSSRSSGASKLGGTQMQQLISLRGVITPRSCVSAMWTASPALGHSGHALRRPRRSSTAACVLAMLAGACVLMRGTEALAQPEMLRETQPANATSGSLVKSSYQLGDSLIVQINDNNNDRDAGPLYLTDGTPQGTRLIEARALAGPARPVGGNNSVRSFNWPGVQSPDGRWFFATSARTQPTIGGSWGMTIWSAEADGRVPGPVFLGSNGAVRHPWPDPARQSPLVSTGDAVYWMGQPEFSGRARLYRSDWNSPPETVNIPVDALNFANTETYTALNGRLIFSSRNEPWITGPDGLSASRLANLRPERFIRAVTLGNRAYLLTEGSSGASAGLWSTDGTEAGTVRLADTDGSDRMFISGDRLYFSTFGATGWVWASTTGDGTVQRTPVLPFSFFDQRRIPFRGGFLVLNSFVLGGSVTEINLNPSPFSAFNSTSATIPGAEGEILVWSNGNQLFRTDGTPGGTYAIEQSGGGALTGVYQVVGTAGGKVIFEALQPGGGAAIYASDGSRFGTTLLTSLALRGGTNVLYTTEDSVVRWSSGPTSSPSYFESEGSNDRSTLIAPGFGIGSQNTFPARGGVYRVSGLELDQVRVLWAASTLEEGVEIGRATVPTVTRFDRFEGMVYEDRLVFVARGRAFGAHPESGVRALTGPEHTFTNNLTRLADGSIVIGGSSMLRTKGTPESSTILTTQGGTLLGALSDDKFVIVQGARIFGISARSTTPESSGLWVGQSFVGGVDRRGSIAGPRVIMRAVPSDLGLSFDYELWSTDGTRVGTSLLLDIYPGPVSSDPGSFVTLRGPDGERAFFFATSPEHGREPWITDGTLGGTSLLLDIAPGPRSSRIRLPLSFDQEYNEDHPVLHVRAEDVGSDRDYVIFYADAPGPTPGTTTGVEPWISDGTPEGTRSLGETFAGAEPGLPSSFPRNITSIAGDYLYLAIASRTAGAQLFAVPLGLQERNLCDYDYNRDGNVDSEDAQLMAAVFVGQLPTNPAWFGGDLDASGNADLEDAQTLARYVVTGVCE